MSSAAGPQPVRLNSTQLRELSEQWRQRADEDPQKAQRIADVLDWLATERDSLPASLGQGQVAQPSPGRSLLQYALALCRRAARGASPRLAR